MANINVHSSNKHRGLKIFAIVVSVLLVLTLVFSLLFIGRTTNGFTEMPVFDDGDVIIEVDDDENEVDPNDPEAMRISLSVVRNYDLSMYSDVEDPLASYTVSANIQPQDADVDIYSWDLSVSPSYVGYDGNNQEWLTVESVNQNMDQYIQINDLGRDVDEGGKFYCDVSCFDLFGCPFVLTFTVTDMCSNTFSCSCSINYKSYLKEQHFTMTNESDLYGSDPFGGFVLSYVRTEEGDSYSIEKESGVVDLSLDICHLVYSSMYTFTMAAGAVSYTVGSVECTDSFPSVSFSFLYNFFEDGISNSLTSSSVDWSSITGTLLGVALGNGDTGNKTKNDFIDYIEGNPLFILTLFIDSSSVSFDVYPDDYDSLYVPIGDVTMNPSDGIIFG